MGRAGPVRGRVPSILLLFDFDFKKLKKPKDFNDFMPETQNNDLWQKQAGALARQFVMMLNGSMLYGCGHPNTAKSAVAFCELLNGCFGDREMITVISNSGTLMFEDWPLDRSFNVGKLLSHFDKLGLVSISFERGVGPDSIIQLVGLAGDAHNVDACRARIAEARAAGSIPRVRINYVLYGKITADEVVVNAAEASSMPAAPDGPPAPASNISTANLSREAAAQIEEVLTLSSLLEKPKEISAVLAQTDTSRFPADELHSAFGKIKGEVEAAGEHNVDELLVSLQSLKHDLYEAIEVQKTTGRMMRSAAIINKELSDLTSVAIVKLVKDEYKSGKTPLNRLAHTIRRMLPNNAELMHILPRMKEMLLAEGMALGDYLELVRMLGLKIESEALSDSLKDAAEAVGASVADLVSAIQSRPEEAARLILLASEVRRGTGEGASGLPELLTGYIEDVCSKMAVDACDAGGAGGGGEALKKTLAQLESQMFNQLARQGIPEPVLMNVRQRLADRFNNAAATAGDTLSLLLKKHAATTAGASRIKMPSEALTPGNLLFLINKEVKRHLRYKSQFATVTVSIEKVIQGDTARPPKPEDAAELLPQLFTHVESLLRDVDLIGTTGTESNPELFILLPMTGDEGTAIVKERIIKKVAENTYVVFGHKAKAAVKVSVATPNENTKDLKSYLALARANHRNEK